MAIPGLFLTMLEEASSHVLRFDPETLRKLGQLDGKVIGLRLAGVTPSAAAELYLFPSESGFRVKATYEGVPDVTITGNIALFGRLMFGEIVPGATGTGEMQISGDIELGQRFKDIFAKMQIDWEEHVAAVAGDVAAHQLGNAVRGFRHWSRHAAETFAQDVTEYLQEESGILARRARVDAFMHGVDELRAGVDRMEKRLGRLRGAA